MRITLAAFAFAACVVACDPPKNGTSTKPSSPKFTAAQRAGAENLIRQYQQLQIIGEVSAKGEVVRSIHAVVKPKYYTLSYNEKGTLVNCLRMWGSTDTDEPGEVVFHDWQTNKDVGRWSEFSGLKIDK